MYYSNTFCVSNLDNTQQLVSKLEATLAEEMPAADTIDSKWICLHNAIIALLSLHTGKRSGNTLTDMRPTGRTWSLSSSQRGRPYWLIKLCLVQVH